jgi:hypothetical protein
MRRRDSRLIECENLTAKIPPAAYEIVKFYSNQCHLEGLTPFQGCEIMGNKKPRAALRSALGYPIAPRWG